MAKDTNIDRPTEGGGNPPKQAKDGDSFKQKVKAIQFCNNYREVLDWISVKVDTDTPTITKNNEGIVVKLNIPIGESYIIVKLNDWIFEDTDWRLCVCDPEVFEDEFEALEEEIDTRSSAIMISLIEFEQAEKRRKFSSIYLIANNISDLIECCRHDGIKVDRDLARLVEKLYKIDSELKNNE